MAFVATAFMLFTAMNAIIGNVRADVEPNDSFATAETITLTGGTGTTTGSVSSTDVSDFYKFQVTIGDTIVTELSWVSGNGDFDLYLYNTTQAEVDYSWNAGMNESIIATADATGFYYVEVNHYSGSGTYQLSVAAGSAGSDTDGSIENATEISYTGPAPTSGFTITINGNFSSTDAADYYKIFLFAGYNALGNPGGNIADKLTVTTNMSSDNAMNVGIYDPYKYDLYWNSTDSSAMVSKAYTVAYYTNYYYIAVENDGNVGTWTYTMKIEVTRYTPWTNDTNNAPQDGEALTFTSGTATSVQTISNETDPHDWFALPLQVNTATNMFEMVSVSVIPPVGCFFTLWIYNETDTAVLLNYDTGPTPVTLSYWPKVTGTYKIRCWSLEGGGLYTMTVKKAWEKNDNDINNASWIEPGTSTGNVDADFDVVDYYKINMTAGEALYAGFTYTYPGGDADISGYNTTKTTIDFSWLNDQPALTGSPEQKEFVNIAANVTGVYYFRVISFAGTINYTLNLAKYSWNDGGDNTFATATTVSNGTIIHDAVYGPNIDNNDTFKITANAGDTIKVNLTTENIDEGITIRIYNSTYAQLASASKYTYQDYYTGEYIPAGYYLAASAAATTTGTYYVKVITNGYSGNCGGNYTALFTAMLSDDSMGGANTVLPGQIVTDSVDSTDTTDWYKIYLNAGEAVSVHLTMPPTADFDLKATNSTGYRLDESSQYTAGTTEHIVMAADVAGYYYVRVFRYSGSGTYTLSFDVFPYTAGNDNDLASATTITNDTTTAMNSIFGPTADPADYYKMNIPITAGQLYVNISTEDYEDQCNITILSPSGSTLLSDYLWAGDGQPGYEVSCAVTEAGDYAIVIEDYTSAFYGSMSANYTFHAYYNIEPVDDGTFSGATLVTAGQTISDSVGDTDAFDYYKINLTAGQAVIAKVYPAVSGDESDLFAYDPNQQRLDRDWNSDAEGSDHNTVIAYANVSGTYYIAVQEYTTGSINYDIHFDVFNYVDPAGNSPASAMTVANGQVVSGTTACNGDRTDYYTFTTTDPGYINVSLVKDAFNSDDALVMRLEYPNGTLITSDSSVGVNGNEYSISYNAVTPGTYYLNVTMDPLFTGNYTVNFSLPLSSTPQAPIVIGTPTPGPITLTQGSLQVFSISVADPNGDATTQQWYLDGTSVGGETGLTYTFNAATAGTHNVTVIVTDGTFNVPVTWTVTVNAAGNHAPTIDSTTPAGTTYSMQVSTSQTFSVTASDVDGDTLSYAWTLDGAPVGTNSASYAYTAPASAGTHTIVITVSDGTDTATHTWTVTVIATPVNHAPVIATYSPAYTTYPLAASTALDFYANATDEDGDVLTYTWMQNGTPVGTNSSHYQYAGGNAGEQYIFTVTVSDGALTATRSWTVNIQTTVSQAPTIDSSSPSGSSVSIETNTDQTFSVTASDPDVGDTLTYQWSVDGVDEAGQTTSSFTKQWSTAGTYTVVVEVSDGSWTITREWTVTVTAPNVPPAITASSPADPLTLSASASQTFSVTANDANGDTLTYTWTLDGTPVGTNSASYAYTAPATAGTHVIKVVVSDGTATADKTWNVTVTTTSNHAPEVNPAQATTGTTPEDTPYTSLNLDNAFTDPDGDALTFTAATNANFTVSIDGTTHAVTITPKANWHGASTIIFTASDGSLTCDFAFTLTVTARPDKPTLNGTIPTVTLDEDTTTTLDISPYFIDVDGDTLSFTGTWAHGTITFSNGIATFTPNANWAGTDTATINCSDGTGLFVDGTVTITVNAVNDAPTGASITLSPVKTKYKTTDKITFTASATDVDGDTLTYTWKDGTKDFGTGPSLGEKKLSGGTHTISVSITDGKADPITASVTVKVEKPASGNTPGFEMVAAVLAVALLVGALVVVRRRF